MPGTQDPQYAARLADLSGSRWKRMLDVQRPYRWNLRRHELGRTLDIGCGIGRNLVSLPSGSVGVDHNPESVRLARARGCVAFTPTEWRTSEHHRPGLFDSLLLAHVVEHMTRDEAAELLASYLFALRPGGRVLMICPQERGYRSDATHVEYVDGAGLVSLARAVGLRPEQPGSFPLPQWAGRFFTYNEHTLLATKPSDPLTSA